MSKQRTDVKLWLEYNNTWNHLRFVTVVKNEIWLIQECYLQNVFTNHIYLVYLYEEDLALNNLQ